MRGRREHSNINSSPEEDVEVRGRGSKKPEAHDLPLFPNLHPRAEFVFVLSRLFRETQTASLKLIIGR